MTDLVLALALATEISTVPAIDECKDAAADGNARIAAMPRFGPRGAVSVDLFGLLNVKRLPALIGLQS